MYRPFGGSRARITKDYRPSSPHGVEISGGAYALHTDAVVTLPISKSIALRSLMLATVKRLREGDPSPLPPLPENACADIRDLYEALMEILRVCRLSASRQDTSREGSYCSSSSPGDAYCSVPAHTVIHMGDGAAPFRFLTALAASVPGIDVEIYTSTSLARRPLSPLVDALRSIGADIRYLNREGYPPLHISGRRLDGGVVTVDGGVSSQFASALLLASPLWRVAADIRLAGGEEQCVSHPYLEMTRKMIHMSDTDMEPDWSAASYFYALALMRPGVDIRIQKLTPPAISLQGDAMCEQIFALLGVETLKCDPSHGGATLRGNERQIALMRSMGMFDTDLSDVPDLVPALAVGCCMAGIHFRFRGVDHLRHKESDRLAALHAEMEKIGFALRIETPDPYADSYTDLREDGTHTDHTPSSLSTALVWDGAILPRGESESIDTYRDHRIAMAFAMAASRLPYLSIEDPMVVNKSFPSFWHDLEDLGFSLRYF